mgnify:CR=1 FL=1
MINQFFVMNGYGIYVWSAFCFTILCFISLYLITKFELVKEQKKFAKKFGNLSKEGIKLAKIQKTNKEILTNIPNLNY